MRPLAFFKGALTHRHKDVAQKTRSIKRQNIESEHVVTTFYETQKQHRKDRFKNKTYLTLGRLDYKKQVRQSKTNNTLKKTQTH